MTRKIYGHLETTGEKLSENDSNTQNWVKVELDPNDIVQLVYSVMPEVGPPLALLNSVDLGFLSFSKEALAVGMVTQLLCEGKQ